MEGKLRLHLDFDDIFYQKFFIITVISHKVYPTNRVSTIHYDKKRLIYLSKIFIIKYRQDFIFVSFIKLENIPVLL